MAQHVIKNALVYEEAAFGGLEIKRDLEILLAGRDSLSDIWNHYLYRYRQKSPEHLEFYTIPDIWRLMIHRVISVDGLPINSQFQIVRLAHTYENFIESIYAKTDGGLDALMKCFMGERSILILEGIFCRISPLSLVSTYDLAKLPEAVFHAFVLGLLANQKYLWDQIKPGSGVWPSRHPYDTQNHSSSFCIHYWNLKQQIPKQMRRKPPGMLLDRSGRKSTHQHLSMPVSTGKDNKNDHHP